MKKGIIFFGLKVFTFLLFTFYFLLFAVAYAAPCYGTRMPQKDKWDAGASVHIIENRKLKSPYGKVSSRQYLYHIVWGASDWFSIDGKIGLGDITYKPGSDNTIKAAYPANFAGGYGFRIKLYKNDEQKIDTVLGFQHISVHPSSKMIYGATNNVILDDWQGSFLISKSFDLLTPYIGARLTRLDLIHRIKGGARKRKKSDVDFDAVAGANININKSNYINIEGRFIKETSFNIGVIHEF